MHQHAVSKPILLALLLMLVTPYLVSSQSEETHNDILYVTPDEDGSGYNIHVMDVGSGIISDVDHIDSRRSDTGWSPDGKYIYIIDAPAEDSRVLKLYDAESGSQQTVTTQLIREECTASLSWSPDGRFLAFLTNEEAPASLQVLDTVDNSIRTFLYPAAIYSPLIWSPDSRYLSPLVLRPDDKIYTTLVWNVVNDEIITTLDNDGYSGFSWSPDDQYLTYMVIGTSTEFAVLNINSEEPRYYKGSWGEVWSPNGRYLILYRKGTNSLLQTFILDTTEDEVIQPTDAQSSSASYGWSSDSRYIAYETWSPLFRYFYEDEEGSTAMKSLQVYDITTETTLTLDIGGNFYRRAAWSPRGQVLAYTSGTDQYGNGSGLAVADIATGRIHEFGVAVPEVYYDKPLLWSADGHYLAVWTERGMSIYDHQTGQLRHVTESLDYLLSPRWSADGRYLSVYSFVEANPDIYSIDTADELRLLNITNTLDETEIFVGWRGTGQNDSLIHCGIG